MPAEDLDTGRILADGLDKWSSSPYAVILSPTLTRNGDYQFSAWRLLPRAFLPGGSHVVRTRWVYQGKGRGHGSAQVSRVGVRRAVQEERFR